MNTSFPVFEKYSYIPIIAGPTASGKSALALEICRIADGELVCADSMQIYKGLDIGTAKDSKEEIGDVPHYLTDIVEPGANFSVYDYVCTALPVITDIFLSHSQRTSGYLPAYRRQRSVRPAHRRPAPYR